MNTTRRNFIHKDETFTCKNCRENVEPLGRGCRNHCPHCLHSLHVDRDVPGDRQSHCHGLMTPLRLEAGSRKGALGYDILHECKKCHKQIKNMLADDDAWETIKP